MNYYERHLGDYARDTGHLSLLEHGAYTLLLDRYYATEEGIPATQAYRIARARTAPEREAVDAVLAEFFKRDGDCWRQGRVEAAIAEFQEGDEERAAKRDNAKERQRRTRARRKDLFDQLRDAGIVPAWDTATNELERLLSRAPSQPVTPPVTRDATATQTPITIPIKEQDQKKERARKRATSPIDRPDDVDESTWADWLTLRRAKSAPVTATVLREARAEAGKAGVPLSRFLEIWCARGSQGLQADWLKPNERAGPAATGKPSTSADFRGKTYAGTAIDQLPPDLRDAAIAALGDD